MDDLAPEMLEQSVPPAVAERSKKLLLATCARQRDHVRQIARFKRSDFE